MTQQQNDDFQVEEIEPEEEDIPQVKKVRPSVEGINAPKITIHNKPGVNDLDSFRPVTTRLMPSDIKMGKGGNKGLWVTLIILVLAVAGGYKWYAPYLPDSLNFIKSEKPADQGSVMSESDVNLFGSPTNPATDTTTSAGDNASSTPASTPEQATPAATSTPVVTPPVTTGGKKLKVNQTSVGYLNVRSEPSTAAKLVTKLNPGDIVEYTELKYGWYKVVLPTGQTGWVSGQYVSVELQD